MRKLVIPLLVLGLAASGCASHYIVRLNSGTKIYTTSKPKLKGADYYYKDALGKEQRVSQGSVSEIEPASMAKKEKDPFNPGVKH